MNRRALAARRYLPLLFSAFLVGAPCIARGEGGIDTSVGEPTPPPASENRSGPGGGASEPAPANAQTAEPFKHLRTIPSHEAAGILGKRVIGAAGEDIGMVVDVLIDDVGTPRAAVIDFGGFLGVGNRKIAVDWALLQFRPGDQYAPILLDVTGESIASAPEFRSFESDAGVIVAPPEPPPPPTGEPPPVGSPAANASPPAATEHTKAEPDGKQGEDAAAPSPEKAREASPVPGPPQPRPNPPEPRPPEQAQPEQAQPEPTPTEQTQPDQSPPEPSPAENSPASHPSAATPLPEIKPPEGASPPTGPAGNVPPAEDPGATPAPSLPATPPDARQ